MAISEPKISHHSLFTEGDIYLFKQGAHFQLFEKLGSHVMTLNGIKGTYFAVWAPNAEKVTVIGDFNGWNRDSHPLSVRWDSSGIWEGFISGLENGTIYKYFIISKQVPTGVEKGDPFTFMWENPPKTASIVWDIEYKWKEGNWPKIRDKKYAQRQCG